MGNGTQCGVCPGIFFIVFLVAVVARRELVSQTWHPVGHSLTSRTGLKAY